jgi:trimeric autotransporter adhesin
MMGGIPAGGPCMNSSLRIIPLGVLFGFASVILASAQTVTISPTSLTFANTAIDSTSAAMTVALENSGADTVDIANIAASANFTISANTCKATLDAGKKCTVSVRFTPTVSGAIAGTLGFTDDASGSPQEVSLSGTAIAQATLAPGSMAFSAGVGHISVAQNALLTNNQSSALTGISYTTTGPFTIVRTECTTELESHTHCGFRVAFKSFQPGTATGTLTVSDSAGNSPQIISLSGTTSGYAVLRPSGITFPITEVGDTSDRLNAELYAKHGDVENISISTTGPFAISGTTCGPELPGDTACLIHLTFSPTQPGAATGTLSVSELSDTAGPLTTSLSGTGTVEAVFASPASIDFYDQSVGTTGNPVRVDLFNEGNTQITVTSVSATGDFMVTSNSCMDGVKPDSHCSVDVVFSPTQAGTLSGTLTFVDNATNNPQTVSLSGIGD